MILRTSDFLFDLPEDLIAQYPPDERDQSRLMVLLRKDNRIEHKTFGDIVNYFNSGDLLILNNTRVAPVRLTATTKTGQTLDVLIAEKNKSGSYRVLTKGKYTGRVFFSDDFYADIRDGKEAFFYHDGSLDSQLQKFGLMPLPPYIKRPPCAMDRERYQTVYAEKSGSIAAPTAGLHFTPEIFNRLKHKGVSIEYVALHVGEGTFRPIYGESVTEHKMDSERFEIDMSLLDKIKAVKKNGCKIVSAGTTSTRTIEAVSSGNFEMCETDGLSDGGPTITARTDIFIYPGYEFKAADALLTNFHLPRSTPLMMAAAFAGKDLLMHAYEDAVAARYRFFSYGDVMLIV